MLLREILEHGDLVGRDGAGRPVIQLAIDAGIFDRLMAFGVDDAEREEGGDDELSEVPSGSAGNRCVCYLCRTTP